MEAPIQNPAMTLDATGAIQQLYKAVNSGGVEPAVLEISAA